MARVNAAEFTEKHNRRTKAAREDMIKGIKGVTVAPTKLAAEKTDKMKANLIKAIDSGKVAAGLNRVSLEEWQDKMVNKGVDRVAVGLDEAAPKVQAFAEKLLPHIDQGQAAIKKMPDVTLEDSIQRMSAWARHMNKFKR